MAQLTFFEHGSDPLFRRPKSVNKSIDTFAEIPLKALSPQCGSKTSKRHSDLAVATLNRLLRLNDMQLNPEKRTTQLQPGHGESVESLVRRLLETFHSRFESQSIALELDFDPIESFVEPQLIHSAVNSLLENAIESMPNGGELSVTLIDGSHQWELEIADSQGMAFNTHDDNATRQPSELPVVLPFPETERLRKAHRAAMAHGGNIQTWNCPQGGTAQVLVVPKHRSRITKTKPTDSEMA